MGKRLVFGVGDSSGATTQVNGADKVSYSVWCQILRRITGNHSDKSTNTRYKDVTICDKWLKFANFEEWFDANYVEGFQLDKDLRVIGSRVYSEDTCEFVPTQINTLLITNHAVRGKYPVGIDIVVYLNKSMNKFRARVNLHGQRKYLGIFDTPEEAFQAYKIAKEAHVKDVATEHFLEGNISYQIYTNLLNWEAEPYPD